eukprot:GHVL01033612.1.p1 GENE.GHVL01033612.1~~GHVL01033612.1.p1  ORF type:complete len:514 (-),score=76.93 GHVL01033612.1:756-2297(-)
MTKIKEVVCIHIGQAGVQVAKNIWELFCVEHDIMADGTMFDDTSVGFENDPYNVFFAETACGQHVPRSIFFDLEPSAIDDVRCSTYSKLFHPDDLIGFKQDAACNYACGRRTILENRLDDLLMERVRLAVDLCQNLQGFIITRSIGGGTGSGGGTEAIRRLRDEYGNTKKIIEIVIYPSTQYADAIVEPYNTMFAMSETRSQCDASPDLTIIMDNQQAYKVCEKKLHCKNPTFTNLNHLIGQLVSACTTSLRFPVELNATLDEICTNIIPDERFRYAVMSLSPLRSSKSGGGHESFSVKEIVKELFQPDNFLCDMGDHVSQNRYLSTSVLLRGKCTNTDYYGGRRMPIQASDAALAFHELMNPRMGYSRIRFCPWICQPSVNPRNPQTPTRAAGFKIGVCGEEPRVLKGSLLTLPKINARQGALLANTTGVRTCFLRQYQKFLRLYYHQAFVHHYIREGFVVDEFDEARENVRCILDSYEELLNESQQAELQAVTNNAFETTEEAEFDAIDHA